MRMPWLVCTIFGICLAVVIVAMTWASTAAIRLERSEVHARRLADREENIRLALWRMDSALAPLISEESLRPYFAYGAFSSAERVYQRLLSGWIGKVPDTGHHRVGRR